MEEDSRENVEEVEGFVEPEYSSDDVDSGAERTDFRVYDMPAPLVQEYISMAKLHYDNEVWRVLKDAMELMKNRREDDLERLRRRVDALEEVVSNIGEKVEENEMRIGRLKSDVDYSDEVFDEDNDVPPTLGGEPTDSTGEENGFDGQVENAVNKLKDLQTEK